MKVAEFIAENLVELGVRHVFGVGGANIEDVFAAVQRRRPEIRAVLGKHEHGAGTAADAYARISGSFGVVLATSGGAAMNLVHSLAEARASHVPVLAIVGEPPSDLQGRGAFQDTSGRSGAVDAALVFRAVTRFCARVEHPDDLPRLFEQAVRATSGDPPGPAVLLIAKDRQRAELRPDAARVPAPTITPSVAVPKPEDVRHAAELLGAGPVVVIAGDEVARGGARTELAELVELLDACVAVTPDARDAFDNRDARFLGVAGGMGHPPVARAFAAARTCLLVGTGLPLLARQGLEGPLREKTLISLGRERPFVGSSLGLHLRGELRACLCAVSTALHDLWHARRAARSLPPAEPIPSNATEAPSAALSSASVLRAVERAVPEGAVVLVDAGNTGATAAHGLRAPRDGRWLLAMGMAGMGYAFGASIGAALPSGRRCFVLAGDGAFFMHGFEVHTAVEHALPITYVVFNNSAHGMCLVRERLLLEENGAYNVFQRSFIGATRSCPRSSPPRAARRACESATSTFSSRINPTRSSCATGARRSSFRRRRTTIPSIDTEICSAPRSPSISKTLSAGASSSRAICSRSAVSHTPATTPPPRSCAGEPTPRRSIDDARRPSPSDRRQATSRSGWRVLAPCDVTTRNRKSPDAREELASAGATSP